MLICNRFLVITVSAECENVIVTNHVVCVDAVVFSSSDYRVQIEQLVRCVFSNSYFWTTVNDLSFNPKNTVDHGLERSVAEAYESDRKSVPPCFAV